jgi:hypothetical protein
MHDLTSHVVDEKKKEERTNEPKEEGKACVHVCVSDLLLSSLALMCVLLGKIAVFHAHINYLQRPALRASTIVYTIKPRSYFYPPLMDEFFGEIFLEASSGS